MVNKKIKNSAGSLTGLIFGLILVIGLFTGMFLWLNYNTEQSGVTIDPKYNDTYNKLNEGRDSIDTNIQSMKSGFSNITESSNGFITAWNGMKGLASALKLPITFVTSTQTVFEATIFDTDILPKWATTLISIGIIGFVVLLAYALLKGEPSKM